MLNEKCIKTFFTKDEEFILNGILMRGLLFYTAQNVCKILNEETYGKYFMRYKIHDYYMMIAIFYQRK